MPLRLAYVVGQLKVGGAEQQLYYLLSGLDRSHFDPIVISLGPKPDEYWEKPITQLGVPVLHVPPGLRRSRRAWQLARILRQEKIQIIHAWVFHTNPYSALAGKLANVALCLGSMRENYHGLPSKKVLRWV